MKYGVTEINIAILLYISEVAKRLQKRQLSTMMELPHTNTEDSMPTDELIIRVFCIVDERLVDVKKRADARLYPSEIVTIGLIFALKGGKYRPFYRWIADNVRHLFPKLPELSRLQRLLRDYG